MTDYTEQWTKKLRETDTDKVLDYVMPLCDQPNHLQLGYFIPSPTHEKKMYKHICFVDFTKEPTDEAVAEHNAKIKKLVDHAAGN